MVYPIAVIVIAGVVVGVILWKVIPTFASLFAGLGAELPLPTRVVIALSDNLVRYFPFLFVDRRRRRLRLHAVLRHRRTAAASSTATLLKLPVLGQHPAQDRGGAVLPHAGDADQLGRADSRRPRNHRARPPATRSSRTPMMLTRKSIERGETIVGAARRRPSVFPAMVTQMIGVGEATGALDTMLAKIADFYEEEVDAAVAGLLTLLEPIMIAFLGVVVGGIVIAMYMPIFDLISKLT